MGPFAFRHRFGAHRRWPHPRDAARARQAAVEVVSDDGCRRQPRLLSAARGSVRGATRGLPEGTKTAIVDGATKLRSILEVESVVGGLLDIDLKEFPGLVAVFLAIDLVRAIP